MRLKEVRVFLSDKNKWTKEVQAKDKKGNAVAFDSNKAQSWCLLGAIYKSCNGSSALIANQATEVLSNALGGAIHRFNDDSETTHADVLNFLDNVIEMETR